MSDVTFFQRITGFCYALAFCVAASTLLAIDAHAADRVTTYKDENGWKLLVNGEDFYIKGVVWGYMPRGENYTYNLWAENDDFVRKVLDYEFGLMKAANVNAIRSFATIPPKWVTYAYEEYGIMTAINPLMGRYGATIAGKWVPFVDYSDELTRATLKTEVLEAVETYKDVPGVLMFALGNESNYGLSWSSFEIENLPEGERNTAKARYLYSLYNEVIAAGKKIDSKHPFTIVNGDLQYIDLIAEYCVDMDLLGSNVYRGKSVRDLWSEVEKKLDMPVAFFEFGADAFNAREFREDQKSQAVWLKAQWQEMYNKSYGNGEDGNSIGGFVFEWRDEWWKYLQVERLDIQDTNASWANGGYDYDFVDGQNNMNEEWWGITALGTPNSDGVYTARPRMAYDVLAQIWGLDPYTMKKSAFNDAIDAIDMDFYELKGEVRALKTDSIEKKKLLTFAGGSLKTEFALKGTEQELDERGENGVTFTDGEMVFLDFEFEPSDRIEGQFSLNVLGNVADLEPLEIQYGRRGAPVTILIEEDNPFGNIPPTIETTEVFQDRERVEIYDFEASYRGEVFDLNAFSHVPRYHWKTEGDFFGLVLEATDIHGEDIWNAKAPQGIEFEGKKQLDGLKVLFGPEVYWGANPKVVLKYSKTLGKNNLTFMHSEDVARREEATGGAGATGRQSRQTTLYWKRDLIAGMSLELGGSISATEKVDDEYDRIEEGGFIVLDEIDFEDTLGLKAKLSFPLFGGSGYVSAHHAGLVAETGAQLREFGVTDPMALPYSSLGNKREYEAGWLKNFGNFMIFPRFLYRDNLVDANPNLPSSIDNGVLNPGLIPRNTDDDPFAVVSNREARSVDLLFTYDPTGASFFYDWDNDFREDARFAFDLAANYTEFPTRTDSDLFFFVPIDGNAPFGRGLPAEDVWQISSKMVFNPSPNFKLITKLKRAFQQSTGEPDGGTRKFWDFQYSATFNKKHILSGYFKKDAFGPYDFYRQFNLTFPEQIKLDYSILLDPHLSKEHSTQIGVRTFYRTTDENSPDDEYLMGQNDYSWQTVFYFIYNFGGTGTNVLPRN